MNFTLAFLAILTGTALPAADALLPDPAVFRTEGATIRLVASPPDGAGHVRGAVVFDLEPGWKTYWQEPGEAGLAPEFRFRDVDPEMRETFFFPVPSRLEEAGQPIIGYDAPVAIAFTIDNVAAGESLSLDLHAGLCREICVPITAQLRADPSGPADAGDLSWIDRAFIALPTPADASLSGAITETDLVLSGPEEVLANVRDIFVAGDGWAFGEPRNEGRSWRVPVRMRPEESSRSPALHAIIDDGRAGRRAAIDFE